jgi:hypothetical protein
MSGVQDIFSRLVALRKGLPKLLSSMLLFVKSNLGPWLANKEAAEPSNATLLTEGPRDKTSSEQIDELLRRVRTAERILASSVGRTQVKEGSK